MAVEYMVRVRTEVEYPDLQWTLEYELEQHLFELGIYATAEVVTVEEA